MPANHPIALTLNDQYGSGFAASMNVDKPSRMAAPEVGNQLTGQFNVVRRRWRVIASAALTCRLYKMYDRWSQLATPQIGHKSATNRPQIGHESAMSRLPLVSVPAIPGVQS